MTESKQTYIADGEAASKSLAAMAARAEVLKEKLAGLASRIEGIEAGKPWGTAEEYGGQFEKVYDAGDRGAAFVREHLGLIADETTQGSTKAHQALSGSLELDHEGASLFQTDTSDAAGAKLSQIAADRDSAMGT